MGVTRIAAAELQRTLDRLCAAVAEEDPIRPRCMIDQRLRQFDRRTRVVQVRQMDQSIGVFPDGARNVGIAVAERVDRNTGDTIQIATTFTIVEKQGDIREGNALRGIKSDERFERIVMNPPFGEKSSVNSGHAAKRRSSTWRSIREAVPNQSYGQGGAVRHSATRRLTVSM